MKRLERLTAILSLLQSRRYTRLAEIEKRFGTSERTAFRDIRALQESGAPISFEKEKGYYILDRHFLPPLSFTIDEAKSFIFVEQLAKKYTDDETFHHFSNALEKIKTKLRDHQLEDVEILEEKISVYINPVFSQKYLRQAEQACSQKIVLKIKYQDINGKITERKIEPIGITFYSQGWHLIAYCQLREDYRDFLLTRVQDLKFTGEEISGGHWTLAEYIQNL